MFGLGLTITIIIYVLLVASIILYFVFVMMKKYKYCDMLEKIAFFHALFALMIESWALILMNEGFNINFNIEISVNMYISIALLVPLIALLVVSNIIYRKKYSVELNRLGRIGNYMILPSTIFALLAATLILFFNINYFTYYNVIP